MKTYVMKNCGCRIVEKDLAFDIRGSRRCPEHIKNGVEYIEKTCPDCGIQVIDMKSPFTRVRCEICAKKHDKKRMRLYDMHRVRKYAGEKRRVIEETHKFDVSLYTQGLSRYLPQNEQGAS